MTPAHFLAPRLLTGFSLAALLTGAGFFASSRPAHTAGGPIAVNVANIVPTVNTESASKQPFQMSGDLINTDQSSPSLSYEADLGVVPPGKRLVIVSISGVYASFGDRNSYTFDLFKEGASDFMALSLLPNASPFPSLTQQGRLTLEPGSRLLLNVTSSGSSVSVQYSVSGYYVDVP